MNVSPQEPVLSGEHWKERLNNIVNFPNRNAVEHFLDHSVRSAFNDIATLLKNNQIETKIERLDRAIVLTVMHGNEHDFVYGVYRRKHTQPGFAHAEQEALDADDEQSYYRAEVHLSEGGQDYDIMGWSRVAIINDVIDQYHRHQHFLHMLR